MAMASRGAVSVWSGVVLALAASRAGHGQVPPRRAQISGPIAAERLGNFVGLIRIPGDQAGGKVHAGHAPGTSHPPAIN